MGTASEKQATPALISYSALINFLDKLREHGDVPTRIDRSLMGNASGSYVFALIGALKYLHLIDDAGKPNDSFRKLVLSEDEARKPIIAELLKRRYDFLFSDEHFNLEKATTSEMAEKFRQMDITGSTVTKAITFFLMAAKESGIKVSPHIKPPQAPAKALGAAKKASKKKNDAVVAELTENDEGEEAEGGDVMRFEIPIPGKAAVKVIVPNDLDADDWQMLQSMITVYINRWKSFKPKAAEE